MSRARPELIELVPGEYGSLLLRMDKLATAGSGWMNFRPVIAQEHQPDPPGPFAIFGGSAHKVPTATWVPGKHVADGTVKQTTVGLQHSSGPRVVARLRELELPLPEEWRVSQDHPRRGLVVWVPADADNAVTLDWLVKAASAVCAVPTTGRWSVSLY